MAVWWRFRSGGRLWTVYRGTEDTYPEFWIGNRDLRTNNDMLAGATVPECAEVYINPAAHDDGEEEDETVLHELVHVACAAIADEDRPFTRADEERFIRAVSPRLWPLLKARGLRWPSRRPARGGR